MVFSRRRWNGQELWLPSRGPISLEKWGKEHQGLCPGPPGKSFFPHPFSLDCCRSGVGFLSAYLACGLKDQRLMARPPARAGGRSGLLSRGKSGNPNGYFLPSPKGYPSTSPARPAGGRAVTSVTKRGPQAGYPVRSTASPSTTPPEKGSRGGTSSPGVLSPFLPKKWGPGRAGQGSLPFQRRKEKPTMGPARKDPVPRPSHGKGTASHPPPGPAQPSAARAAARRAA